jgi:hypothetical protein
VALRTAARVWEAAVHEPPPDTGLATPAGASTH